MKIQKNNIVVIGYLNLEVAHPKDYDDMTVAVVDGLIVAVPLKSTAVFMIGLAC